MFFMSLMLSTLIVISSYSWMSMWMGLEINLLSFIPLMTNSKNMFPSEAALKYFITQALASNIFLFSIMLLLQFHTSMNQEFNTIMLMILNSALFMKLGAAPFHFWFPEVISGLNWNNALILLTWQKIAPMILLIYSLNNMMYFSTIILMSCLIGGIQNFNQMDLRKILAYSSINHIGWMITSFLGSSSVWLTYFMFYTMISINIILIFKSLNIFYLNQLHSSMNFSKMIKFLFIINFLSLSGLPPFFGFLPKWLTLIDLITSKFIMLSFLIILLTLISMYIYLRITFSSMTLLSTESLTRGITYLSFIMMIYNFITLSGMLGMTLIYLM
uniref:NADH-ubiquinone oxidoreductase chain 2 n=1 Tax=Curculionoidea sp. 25 KM-2017 TaxID=2219409 RepID=A0A346RIA4_9CUCU|nr:NADH dehydrogenase subunit 2 [Curculionoidea sp. 25 KM-2017]